MPKEAFIERPPQGRMVETTDGRRSLSEEPASEREATKGDSSGGGKRDY